jgi:hypothetical protein
MRYIHEECLKIWILTQNRDIKNFQCDVCKATLNMEIKVKLVFSCKNFGGECLKITVFPVVICLVGTVFGIVLLYLATGSANNALAISEKVYLSIVLLTCTLVLLALICIFIRSVRVGCCAKKMVVWKIRPLEGMLNDTMVNTNNTEVCIKETLVNFKIVPEVVRFDGVQTIVPEISHAAYTLFQRIEDGRIGDCRSHSARQGQCRGGIIEINEMTPRVCREMSQH